MTAITRRAALVGLTASAPFRADAQEPLLRIGAIADCQYADEPDNGQRLYRLSAGKLREAVATFDRENVSFAVHLGDFIDKDWASFDTVLPIAQALGRPWHFVLGNHDLLIADDKKAQVAAKLGMPARYYKFSQNGWLFIVLDGNDVSSYGWPNGSPELAASLRIHAERYPSASPWSGAIGDAQLRWLDASLADAGSRGQRAMLLCHFPLWPDNANNLWNAREVMALIQRHPCVKIWLDGHNHDGNYGVRDGIHYLNLRGMLDTAMTSYAVLDLHDDRILVRGFGREQDFSLPLR
jgi:manganese-dependent ADP-ribose/CDP-alcohol diphosphatase